MTTNEAERLLLVEVLGFLNGIALAFTLSKQPGANEALILAARLVKEIE